MDHSMCRKIVLESLAPLTRALHLRDWSISVKFQPLGDNDHVIFADCTPDVRYRKATIRIDPAPHTSRADVLRSLRHELLHVVLAERETYRQVIEPALSEREFEMAEKALERAEEGTVNSIELFLDEGLGLTPERMISMAKSHARRTDHKWIKAHGGTKKKAVRR